MWNVASIWKLRWRWAAGNDDVCPQPPVTAHDDCRIVSVYISRVGKLWKFIEVPQFLFAFESSDLFYKYLCICHFNIFISAPKITSSLVCNPNSFQVTSHLKLWYFFLDMVRSRLPSAPPMACNSESFEVMSSSEEDDVPILFRRCRTRIAAGEGLYLIL